MNEIKKYVKERDTAIANAIKYRDIGTFEDFVKKHTDLYSYYFREMWNKATPTTKWCTVMKMACNCENVPQEVKKQAKEWLTLRGFDIEL